MSTLPLLPLGPRILLLPHTPERRSRGGIELPDSAQVHQPYGTILAISPDILNAEVATPVSVGTEVYFAPYAGTEIHITNQDTGVETAYLVLLLDDLIAIKTPTEVLPPLDHIGADLGANSKSPIHQYRDAANPLTNFPYGTAPRPSLDLNQ